MKHYILPLLFCAGLLLSGSASLRAQMDGPPPDDRPGKERIEQLRRLKMIEALDLDEEQALRLTVREKELKKKEKELMKQRRALLEELQDLLRDDDTDEKITSLLDRMNAVHTEMVKEKQAYLQSLKDFLSIQQVGKLVLFEQRFAEELRRLLSKHGSRRPPPRR